MKRGLKLVILLLCVFTLVGCGAKKDKEEKEVKKVDVKEDINDYFAWAGSYHKDDADIVAEFYVDAYSQDIILTFTQFDEGNVTLEGDTIHYSSGNSRYVTLYADTMTDKEITFDSFGTKGKIKKTKNGLEVQIETIDADVDEDSDYSFMAGTYTLVPSTYELSGFYYNDNVQVAISAAGGYVYVASYVKNGNYSDVKTYHIEDSKTLSYEDIFENEKTTITGTKKGIKIESDDEDLTGEYELLK